MLTYLNESFMAVLKDTYLIIKVGCTDAWSGGQIYMPSYVRDIVLLLSYARKRTETSPCAANDGVRRGVGPPEI